jgi:hypothetical protein
LSTTLRYDILISGDRMQKLKKINEMYDKMQDQYGSDQLNAIYSSGYLVNPDICFIFMNPTGRNIAASKTWQGYRFPWIGTKNIWKLFDQLNLIDHDLFIEIQARRGSEWDEVFVSQVYENILKHRYYITNLAKCTQLDARPLPDDVYKEYLTLLYQEIDLIQPKKIVTFGNQISSIFLDQPISVSQCRRKKILKQIGQHIYPVYPVYYPVGNGMRNIDKAIIDLQFILDSGE